MSPGKDDTRERPRGGSAEDFTDWNNPEDDEDFEDAPEGYYDDDDDDDDGYIPGPDDPDYDLSEAAGYAGWEEPRRRGLMPQWVIVLISIVLILAIVIPLLFRP
jgi:hypothetical protein